MVALRIRVMGLAVVGSLAALLSPALADDAKDAGPPQFSWTGFYLGANAGYAWGESDFSIFPTGAWLSSPIFNTAIASTKSATNGTLEPEGFLGGAQIGYNQQIGNLVLGLEADFDGSNADANRIGGQIPNTITTGFSQQAELSWMATLRARLGVTTEYALVYVTGGVAFGDWDLSMSMTSLNKDAVFNSSSVETGWVVGGGWEYALNNHWSLKGEYLYADFGTAKGTSIFPAPPHPPNVTHDHEVDLTAQVARAGINYRF